MSAHISRTKVDQEIIDGGRDLANTLLVSTVNENHAQMRDALIMLQVTAAHIFGNLAFNAKHGGKIDFEEFMKMVRVQVEREFNFLQAEHKQGNTKCHGADAGDNGQEKGQGH